MNGLIQLIFAQGLSYSMYSWVNTAAFSIAFLYSISHGKKLGVPIWKMFIVLGIVYLGVGYIGGIIGTVVQYVKNIHFLGIETSINSIVRLFVFYPLVALIAAMVLRLKWSLVCDAIVMYPLLQSCVGQLACIFPGCCYGYEWEQGIYNIKTGLYHFPVQILETILTFLIFAYLTSLIKGKKYVSDGSLYPRMMILYGIMRFICELLRDNEKVALGCSVIAFHAIFISIVGIVWNRILSNKKENSNGNQVQTHKTEEGKAN